MESEAFTLRWRRDYQAGGGLVGVLSVTEQLIEVEAAKELGYFHGTDVNGTPLYWVHVKKHNAATRGGQLTNTQTLSPFRTMQCG